MVGSSLKSVVIADDSLLFRCLIKPHLSRELGFSVVTDTDNSQEVLQAVLQHKPDIALLELEMRGRNGIEVAGEINRLSPSTCVILLTDYDQLLSLGQLRGIHTVLSKNCDLKCVTETLLSAHRTETIIGHKIAGSVSTRLERLSEQFHLTERERNVLIRITEFAASTTQIAYELTRETGNTVSENAIKQTLNRIMTKLELEPRTRVALVKFVNDFAG